MSEMIGDLVGKRAPSRKWGADDKLVSSNTFLGLEIELEGLRNMRGEYLKAIEDSRLWTITEDRSLRNQGLEFIMQEQSSKQPLMGKDIICALDAFQTSMDKFVKEQEAPQLSDRTSIHVHIDVRELSQEEFKRFILLYYTFEDILFKWIGEDRAASNYCRPASDNHDIILRAANVISQGDIHEVLRRCNKYDALNLLATVTHGTLEVRSMRGTYDTSVMLRWINILLRILKASKNPTINIDSFPEAVSVGGMQEFLISIFEEQSEELLPFATTVDILQGVRVAQEILVLSDDTVRSLEGSYSENGETLARVNKFKELVMDE